MHVQSNGGDRVEWTDLLVQIDAISTTSASSTMLGRSIVPNHNCRVHSQFVTMGSYMSTDCSSMDCSSRDADRSTSDLRSFDIEYVTLALESAKRATFESQRDQRHKDRSTSIDDLGGTSLCSRSVDKSFSAALEASDAAMAATHD